jgi:hypothetical protein
VMISAPAHARRVREGVLELARRSWNRDRLRERSERFSEARFRHRLAEVLRAHGAW